MGPGPRPGPFASALITLAVAASVSAAGDVVRIGWDDVGPLHRRLEAAGLSSDAFPAHIGRVRETNARRVREGDLDHLIFYLLQSTRFTRLPPIEPALSAKTLVEGLTGPERERFLREPHSAIGEVPAPVRTRLAALLRALDALGPTGLRQGYGGPPKRDARSRKAEAPDDPRLTYFRDLVRSSFPDPRGRASLLLREYLRVMRFVYEKEFVAQRAERPAQSVAALYRTRGLSTDTAVEAGYLVYLGLGVLQSLDPDRRIRRVLIVGPGLDLAPRTALDELAPPESYQPWAVMDALLSLGLARAGDLEMVAADINPRVVEHLRRSRATPPTLTLVSEIRDSDTVALATEYREYFARLGGSIAATPHTAGVESRHGRLSKTIQVSSAAARALTAEPLDIVTERFGDASFDLVIATNILPYFDDVQLMLALSNIAAMLAPGGAFLHNEGRPLLRDVAASLGLPFEQSRHAVLATVRGAPPLGDSVWLHRVR